MRINLKNPVVDYEGKPIIASDTKQPMTLFDVFINGLNGQTPGEVLTAEKKSKIYQISKKIYANKEPNFTPDQCLLIKERVGKIYGAVIYGQVEELIDGEMPQETEKKEEAPDPTSQSN